MNHLLNNANNIYNQTTCCHSDGRHCYCYTCLQKGFYDGEESYDCLKKLCYYVLNYGPSYVNEIYHFLNCSKLLENNFSGNINVLSLGCGFGPDFIALSKYIANTKLQLTVNYHGIDKEQRWLAITNGILPFIFSTNDLLHGFNLSGYNIVFLNKLFSTLEKHKLSNKFLDLFINEIKLNLPAGSIVIFNDVNHVAKGRDRFDTSIRREMNNIGRYFFDVESAYKGNYLEIQSTTNVCQVPKKLSVSPKTSVNKTIFFVYQK